MLIPRQVAAVGKIASKGNTRYAFNGVHFSRRGDKPRASACDGHRLLVVEWEEAPKEDMPPMADLSYEHVADFSRIVPLAAMADVAKSVPKRTCKPILSNFAICEPSANGNIKLASTDLSSVNRMEVASIEGAFPPVDDVIPNYAIASADLDTTKPRGERSIIAIDRDGALPVDTAVVLHVNGKLLAELLAAAVAVLDTDRPTVKLTIPLAYNRPMRIDAAAEGRTVVGVLMPVNAEAH